MFEGPLDLLLYLVKRDGVDLKQLPLARIADSYVEYLDRMRDLNLDVASEYLVMAATLVHLKSLELLPRAPTLITESDEEDPREALARQLAEYARYKAAAEELADRALLGRDTFARDPEGGEPERELEAGIDAFGLLEVYHGLLTKVAETEPTFEVAEGGPDIVSCCRYVLRSIEAGRSELTALLEALPSRLERVATFVAVLEMARLRFIGIRQARHLGPIQLEGKVGAEADLGAITGFVESLEPA